jgi:hypothetical protein
MALAVARMIGSRCSNSSGIERAHVVNAIRKETDRMLRKFVWIGLALSAIGFTLSSSAGADEWNNKTVLTFSQPVEIPGRVLPAGTYTFELADSMSDRHIVQILNADGSQIIATVMTIADYRLTSTDKTVIRFGEMPAGSPEAIRAWFYPGNTIGQEFVYPKPRATELARASNAPVPAMAVDVASVDELKTVPILAVTPEQKEMAVTAAIQTSPQAIVPNRSSSMVGTSGAADHATRLPKTASRLPLIVLLGFGAVAAAFGLMMFGKPTASAV